MTDSTEIIARIVSCITAGRLDLLADDIEAHAQDDTAAADVLSVCAYAASLEERRVFAAELATRAYAARDGASFEDGAVLASALADDRRFSSAVDLLRGTIALRERRPSCCRWWCRAVSTPSFAGRPRPTCLCLTPRPDDC
jgi:hypothetical protein